LGVVAEVADHVVVMYAGQVVEQAPVQALFDTPQHPYTVGLLGSIPSLDEVQGRLASIEGQVPNPLNRPSGCAFAQRCPFVQEACLSHKPKLTELTSGHWSACLRAPLKAETLMPYAPH
jgi:oligopeptide/dipeptide ABC transporter ATP-binding protein